MVLALLLMFAGTSLATTVLPMSVEDLTSAATAVVEVRAVSSRSAWNAEHTRILTYTVFQVQRALKGTLSGKITVKQLGGSAEGFTQKVAGVHHAQAGEPAVLFLRPSDAGDGTWVIVGLMQGHFRVYQDKDGAAMATNGVARSHAVESSSERKERAPAAEQMPMRLSALETRVRRQQ